MKTNFFRKTINTFILNLHVHYVAAMGDFHQQIILFLFLLRLNTNMQQIADSITNKPSPEELKMSFSGTVKIK